MKIKVTTSFIFSIIWLVFLIFFLIMGYQSYMSVNTKLPRYSFEPPTSATMTLGGVDVAKSIEGIAKSHNEAVAKLEESIVNEAKTMTTINLISALLCLLGLIAQIADNFNKSKHKL